MFVGLLTWQIRHVGTEVYRYCAVDMIIYAKTMMLMLNLLPELLFMMLLEGGKGTYIEMDSG